MLPKKKIVQLSKKKVEDELKKQKETLKEQSPLEKAKKAYHETVEVTSPTDDSKDPKSSESSQEPASTETTTPVHTPDISKMVDRTYDQIQRTTRGLAAAASAVLGESVGGDTSEKSTSQSTGTKEDAASLARKILERKKKAKRD